MGNFFSWWSGYNVEAPKLTPPTTNVRVLTPPTTEERPRTAIRGRLQQDVEAPQAHWEQKKHSIKRLTDIRGVSAHGNLVWVTAGGGYDEIEAKAKVAVLRTTDAHDRHVCVATHSIDSPLRIVANDNVAWLSLESTGQIQELRLNGTDIELTGTFPDAGKLTAPEGLAYKESTGTLYICCTDGVKLVNVAKRNVVGTLRGLRRPDLPRPLSVSVLNSKILVAHGQRYLVLYANEAEEGTLLQFQTPPEGPDMSHHGDYFLVCDSLRRSLRKVNQNQNTNYRVEELTEDIGDANPWRISCVRAPNNHYFLYVVDTCNHSLLRCYFWKLPK